MKLPRADEAIIDISKIRDYCLDPRHPRGKHKARIFKSALGLTQRDAVELKQDIAKAILVADCQEGEKDIHGNRYIVDLEIVRANRTAQIRTNWIIKKGESLPRLTSCYVRE